MKALLFLILLGAGGYYLYYLSTGFNEDNIEHVKRSIRTEYEKKAGRVVEEVSMLKKSSHELTGFVRFKDGGISANLDCSATMEQTGSRYIWRCGR
jgi:hypothetical protein